MSQDQPRDPAITAATEICSMLCSSMARSGLRRAIGRGGGLGRPRFSSQFTRIGGAVIRVGGAVIRIGGAAIRIGGAATRIGGASPASAVQSPAPAAQPPALRRTHAHRRCSHPRRRRSRPHWRCSHPCRSDLRRDLFAPARRIGLHIEIARARHRRTGRPTGNVRRYGSRRFRHYSPTRRVPLEPEKYVILTVALPPC